MLRYPHGTACRPLQLEVFDAAPPWQWCAAAHLRFHRVAKAETSELESGMIKMATGVIVYQSKYGATKKYVDWLIEETNFDCIEASGAKAKDVKNYRIVVLCGGVYASGIAGISFFRKNYPELKDKKLAIFCVGASPFEEQALCEVKTHNLKEDLKNVPMFYGRGAWDEGKMTFKDRTLCKMLKKAIAKKDPDTYEPWMKALMEAGDGTCDWTDKAYLEPLLEYLDR